MNRLAMAEEIAQRGYIFAQCADREWQRLDKLRASFVDDYSVKKILGLTLDQYVSGKGAANHSFCYRLEQELDSLGTIKGTPCAKFGVYFGKRGKDKAKEYRFVQRWGKNLNDAFLAVKQAIADLLEAAEKEDFAAIAQNPLSAMVKGKILFLYHPDQYVPIYSEEYLQHFVKALNLADNFECGRGADMQRALMRYRDEWPELRSLPPGLYQHFLYEVFGNPKDSKTFGQTGAKIAFLKTAIDGAQFIGQLPPSSPAAGKQPGGTGKINYEARQKSSKRIGDRGERIVLALEKQRLIAADKSKLAADVDHVAERDDGLGYDILSFEEDGTERPIEVKATTAPNLQNGFYISANELEKSGKLPNYHLYLVFSALSNSPRVFLMKNPDLKGMGFILEPLNYLVTPPRVL